jgi:hypothetical protein
VLEHLKESKRASIEMERASKKRASLAVSLPLENLVQKLSRVGFVGMKLLGEPLPKRIGHVPVTKTPDYHYRGDVRSYKVMCDWLAGVFELSRTGHTPIGIHRSLNINAIPVFRKR